MVSIFKYLTLLAFLSCVGAVQAAPQPTAVLTDKTIHLSLAKHLDILEDPERSLGIQEVISPQYAAQFYANTQDTPNFGRTHSAYWVRFTLSNQSELQWYTRIKALLGHDVTLYVLNNNGQIITDEIAHYLPKQGLHTWSLKLPEQQTLQFYLRATNGDSIFSLPLELFASDAFVEQTRLYHNLYASIIAALLIMAIYNLLSYFVLRESSYFALAIHIASVAVIVQITNPVYEGLDFLQNTDLHFFTAPIYIAVISFLVFCRRLLLTNENLPRLDKLISGTVFASGGLMLVTGWVPQGAFLSQLMFVIAFALIMVASVMRTIQGYRIAKYFLGIFLLIIVMVIPSAVINVVAETQWQSSNFYTTGITTLLFLLFLSIVQSLKVRERREQEQLAVASKQAADNFLMTISHELRTPMQALIGIGELLEKTPLNSTQQDYLRKQDYASKHMLELINDILDFSVMSKDGQAIDKEYESFYLQGLLDDLDQLLSVSAKQKALTLTISKAPSCPPLLGDVSHLKQVLVNLLDNAIKFTEQGCVELAIQLQKNRDQRVMTVTFQISDTGVGIPVDQHPHLFEPFFQIGHPDRQRSGSGLGLAISHQLVRQMGGELRLRNRLKHGTCFFFTLDLRIDEQHERMEIAASKNKISLKPLNGSRILFVEDDSLNQLIGQKLLTSQGADVLLASSGREAIRQMREQPCDLVLMDLDLPDIDGYETTLIIKADKSIPDCPIIALTAHAIGGEEEQCLDAGMSDYLAKPYNIDELIDMILKHHKPA